MGMLFPGGLNSARFHSTGGTDKSLLLPNIAIYMQPVSIGGLRVLDTSMQLPFANFPKLSKVSTIRWR